MAAFVFALLPPDFLPTREVSFNFFDKVQHVIVFGGLCIIGSKGYLDRSYSLMFGLLMMGGTIEVGQYAIWTSMILLLMQAES